MTVTSGEFAYFSSALDGFTIVDGDLVQVQLSKYTNLAQPKSTTGQLSAKAHYLPLYRSSRSDDSFLLPPGLTVISGGTAVGKSAFIADLGRILPMDSIARLNTVEPFDDFEEANQQWFSSADAALAEAVMIQTDSPGTLPVIDSLRAVLFEMSGNATSKGMVARFFTQITRVSNSLAAHGRTVLATVNPMESSTDFVAEFLARLSAALPCTIVLTDRSESSADVSYAGYTTSRDHVTKRRPVPFKTAFQKAGSSVFSREPTEFVFEQPAPLRTLN